MSIVQTVPPERATGKVEQVYRDIEGALGYVPNAFRLYSSSPNLLEQHWQQTKYYVGHPTLSSVLLATIRMLVSQENDCAYCVGFNEAMLIQRAGLAPERVAETKRNPEAAPLSDRDRALLLFVLKATKTPKAVDAADLDDLRALGWQDSEIVEAVYHGARNMAADVVFNAFKIEVDA